MPGQDFGPSLFPTIIGCRFPGLRRGHRGPRPRGSFPARKPRSASPTGSTIRKRSLPALWLVLGMAGYIAAFDAVGFILLSIVYTGGMMLILRVRLVWAVVCSVSVTLLVFELFTRMLYVPLPMGLLDFSA